MPTFHFNDVERDIIKRTARRIWNEIANDCGAPDDPEVIAECVMDADRLTLALRRSQHTALEAKVEMHITTKELENIVRSAF